MEKYKLFRRQRAEGRGQKVAKFVVGTLVLAESLGQP